MTEPGSAVLIVGGGSRLAGRIRAILPAARVVVRRGSGSVGEVEVADYATIPAAAFVGIATVVNCVGTPVGDADALRRVNVTVPVAAAIAARDAGCRHFIQLGSWSVYGHAPAIGGRTPIAPVTAYGRSKAAADVALLALATPEFAVTIVRVPALYGVGAAGKLGTLARAMRRVGFVVSRDPARRSFLNLDNAAATIARLIAEPTPRRGVVLAADHDAFDLPAFAAAVAADDERPVRLLTAPDWLIAGLRRVAPGVHASVFAPSLVDPAAAITTDMPLPVALRDGIAAMLAAEPRTR